MSDRNNAQSRALSRRCFSAAALSTLGTPTLLRAQSVPPKRLDANEPHLEVPERLQAHLSELFKDQPLHAQGITLSLPPLAENGNSVALGVTIEAVQASDPFIEGYIFAEKNPLPDIARFTFANPVASQQLALRIRLADSQQILAVAKTRKGNLYAASASIIVTLAACIDIPL